ncbi:MAG TPA: protein kinase [Polyangiaceae bacterium]
MSSGATSPTTALPLDDDSADAAERQRLPDPVLPKPGHLLAGKYRVDGAIGRGGMGVVAAGHQLSLDRPVAIKFLRQALAGTARQRFTREAMAIARMQSEHVVRVFDAGEEDGVPFIVMERLVGNDLAAELGRGPLRPEVAVSYLREACEAIAEAHSLGIVHRDLKPSNLFIAEGANGRRIVKVLDFGVSKWLGSAPDGETPLSTADHGLVGTPAYVSPEQLTTPGAVDGRTDLWALGVVLYQCLSGKRPFEVRGIPQLCAAILTAQTPELDPNLGVPEALRAIIRRCLRKKPAERYASVDELDAALAASMTPPSAAGRVFGAVRSRPALAFLVASAVVALGAASIRFHWIGRDAEERPAGTAPAQESQAAGNPVVPGVSPLPPAAAAPTSLPVVSASATPPAMPSAPKARVVREARRSDVKAVPSSAAPASSGVSEQPIEKPSPKDDASKPMYRR